MSRQTCFCSYQKPDQEEGNITRMITIPIKWEAQMLQKAYYTSTLVEKIKEAWGAGKAKQEGLIKVSGSW